MEKEVKPQPQIISSIIPANVSIKCHIDAQRYYNQIISNGDSFCGSREKKPELKNEKE